MTRPTGCKRDSAERLQRRVAAGSPIWSRLRGELSETFVVPDQLIREPLRYHDQPRWGSCVGESLAGMVEVSQPLWGPVSGCRIWADARRREGLLHDTDQGTYPFYAFEALEHLGPCSYHPGEETDRAFVTRIERPDEGMLAADRRQRDIWLNHHAIDPTDPGTWDLIRQLMAAGWQVQICTGTTEKYQRRGQEDAQTPAGTDELGGDEGGHAQYLLGWLDPETPIIQNSWGIYWGGAVGNGRILYGACLTALDVIINAWEINAIRVTG